MNLFTMLRALLVRVLFATHGLVTIGYLYRESRKSEYWYLASAAVGLVLECIVTFGANNGREWKWFCPSAFFYLLITVPSTWFLELELVEWRIKCKEKFNTTSDAVCNSKRIEEKRLHNQHDNHDFLGSQDFEQTIRTLEQLLLLLLILGRWMLPKGKLTHDQLSQLLLVYIGTAADIVEFFEAFKEDVVKRDKALIKLVLTIWTWSLLQFVLVITAQRARKDQSGLVQHKWAAGNSAMVCSSSINSYSKQQQLQQQQDSDAEESYCTCTPEIFGIVISMLLQDMPYLVVRLYIMINYNTTSYTNIFFTLKNTLVCTLLTYRLIVIYVERFRRIKKARKARRNRMPHVVLLDDSDGDDDVDGDADGEKKKAKRLRQIEEGFGRDGRVLNGSSQAVRLTFKEKYTPPEAAAAAAAGRMRTCVTAPTIFHLKSRSLDTRLRSQSAHSQLGDVPDSIGEARLKPLHMAEEEDEEGIEESAGSELNV